MARKLTKKQRRLLEDAMLADAAPAPTLDAIEEAARPQELTYTRAEVEEMIDRDRVASFMVFVRAMTMTFQGQVFGTAAQARSIARELEKLGY